MPLVETVSSETMGLKATEMNDTSPESARARLSAFFHGEALGHELAGR